MKIDKRVNYKIVLDTETCPLDRDFEGVVPQNMWVYDIGWVVTDKRGNIYEARSFVNADIFLNEKIAMTSAYYSEKIPKYWEKIKSGEAILTSFYNIRKQLMEDIETYGVKEIFAHNMRFDYGSLNNTQKWLTKSKYRYYFPYDIEICDTLKMARDVIIPMKTYQNFCFDNGFVTKHKTPRPQATAEVLYRFITKEVDFEESHTALEDALIESQIMAYCYKQHKKMRKGLWEK